MHSTPRRIPESRPYHRHYKGATKAENTVSKSSPGKADVDMGALFIEYGDHPRREGIIGDLRDLQKLVAVY
jgi:hypothetical protein